MAQRSNIVSLAAKDRSVGLSGAAREAIAESRGVVERALPKLMTSLFEKLDDTLYELADKSESNQLQTAYFDAMRAVRRQRERIHGEFVDGVLQDFDRLWVDGPRDLSPMGLETQSHDSSLALVDDEELEQSLAVSNLVSKGENRYQRELFNLRRRFITLLGGKDLKAGANPLGPAAICNRFHLTIRDLAVETPVLLVIYKLFDKQVMNYVGGLYEEINSLLNRAGFSPWSKPPGRSRTRTPASDQKVPETEQGQPGPFPGFSDGAPQTPYPGSPVQGYSPSGYPSGTYAPGSAQPQYPAGQAPAAPNGDRIGLGAPGHGPETSAYGDRERAAGMPPAPPHSTDSGTYGQADPSQAVFFTTLQDLLAGYRSSTVGQLPIVPEGLPVVATPELIGALSALQRAFLQPGLNDAIQGAQFDLRGQLTDALGLKNNGKASRSLDKADDDTIDVVAMLFDFLLDDPNLPDPMKALIARLQIPMLKVALMDKEFFSRRLHPARRLLNNLARAALGWTDDGDRSENSLYGRISSVVKRVIDGFEDDPSLFENLNEEFSAYVERERRVAEIAEERTNQVTRGKEQLRVAKQLVAEEISGRMSRYQRVPLVVRTLLDDAWKDVLLLAYLRQGADSDAWHGGLDIVDRLLRSVEPRAGYAERQELLRTIPELLRSLREGLTGISYDQHKMARLFKELQSCHIACLRGGPAEAGLPENFYRSSAGAAGAMPDAAVDELEEESTIRRAAAEDGGVIQHDEFTDQAESLSVGAWLELQDEDAKPARIKLSWKSDISDTYVFVNRKGIKVLEMTVAGVARLFRSDTARALQQVDTPVMDKAMDAMIETLKSAGSATA